MPTVYASDDKETMLRLKRYMSDYHVGGIVLLKGNLRSAAEMIRVAAMAEIPLFVAIDAEWGLGMRLTDAPGFPRNGRLGDEAMSRCCLIMVLR